MTRKNNCKKPNMLKDIKQTRAKVAKLKAVKDAPPISESDSDSDSSDSDYEEIIVDVMKKARKQGFFEEASTISDGAGTRRASARAPEAPETPPISDRAPAPKATPKPKPKPKTKTTQQKLDEEVAKLEKEIETKKPRKKVVKKYYIQRPVSTPITIPTPTPTPAPTINAKFEKLLAMRNNILKY